MVSVVVAGSSLGAQVVGGVSGMPGVAAQAPAVEPSTGTVTGVVIAGDTQRPVRLAQVQLQRVTPEDGGQGGGRFGNYGGAGNVRTDVDGTFTAKGVPVGDYYALVSAAGYVSQGALLRAQVAAGADPGALLAALPVVRVTADSSSNVTVTIQRGGVIAGHVEWEDGSSASGVSVIALSTIPVTGATSTALQRFPNLGPGPQMQTDDRGNFRLTGLASGEYVVMATMQIASQTGTVGRPQGFSMLRVYAPGASRKADAKPISVRAGDERTDARIVIDFRGRHTVSGQANSSNPGETVASGNIQLIDGSDSTLNVFGQVDADGSFKLRYVPPGTYTLRITGANSQAPAMFRGGGRGGDRDNGGTQPKGVAYQDFATTITLSDTDITGVAVSLVPVQSH
jgi:hypothetical protein